MTLHTRSRAVRKLVGHAVHDVVDYALHHEFHVLHHDHPHHHHPVVVHTDDGAAMDDLEGRTMMSAAVPHHVTFNGGHPLPPGAYARPTPAVSAEFVFAAAAKKTTSPTTTVTPAAAGPAAVADPVVTDGGFTYKSFANDPLFGPGGPSINDVSQGELGDCYLLSVLSSVAKTDAALIRQLITANANGTYTVHFGGLKAGTAVTVDAELPTLPGTAQPAYAQLGAGDSTWVALVEKAYADYVNPKADSYGTISGGWMGDAFAALGLKSTSTFSAASATALAMLAQKDLKAGDFVTMGTTASASAKTGLIAGHAYELDSVTVDKHGTVTAVTLRNPWGNDVADGGYVTVTAAQMFAAFAGLSVAHA